RLHRPVQGYRRNAEVTASRRAEECNRNSKISLRGTGSGRPLFFVLFSVKGGIYYGLFFKIVKAILNNDRKRRGGL
ncbi:MAG: hypothetical protein J6M46_09430, partial [Lachnospiraceae bacterium]|nr:hypothetical protein [Lachnospiraceae bacterium]